MFRSARTFKLFLFILGIATVIFDQTTKFLIKKIPETGIFLFKTDFLNLKFQLAHNPFIAFSLPVSRPLILLLSLIIFGFLIYYIQQSFKKNNLWRSTLLILIISAAFSNFLDRLFFKNVIDFISITIYNYSWPIFNFADTVIVITTVVFLIYELKNPEKKL